MREIVTDAVPRLIAPSRRSREEALEQAGNRLAHDIYLRDWPCMNTVEAVEPETPARPDVVTIAAWNMERCKHVEESAALIRRIGADVVLATEMDVGMARSGQRNTVRDMARALGMGWAFGVEFVELKLGNPFDRESNAGRENAFGLHGNAVLSRLQLSDVALIPLDDGGDWYVRSPKGDGQRRVGGRMAMAAWLETGFGPLAVAAAHFESESDPAARTVQTARLTGGLERLFGPGPCVIGGDLNTHAFHDEAVGTEAMLDMPWQTEPAFEVFAESGYDWRDANTGAPTTRRHLHDAPERPMTTIDWFLARGVTASGARIVPALAPDNTVLSDHEVIVLRVGA